MKTLLFVITFLLSMQLAHAQQSGWFWQSPNFCTDLLGDVKVVSSNTAYAVGYAGIFMRSTDAGLTWSNPLCDSSYRGLSYQRLSWQFYINPNTGWSVGTYASGGSGSILRTTNAGNFWTRQVTPSATGDGSLFFLNDQIGWFVDGNRVLKTTNGGSTWDAVNAVLPGNAFAVHFTDANTGCAAGSSFFKTTDGGSSWQSAFNFYGGKIYSFCFVNSLTGFACGTNFSPSMGMIYKTTNGGLNWVYKYNPGGPIISSICFPTATFGIGVGGSYGGPLYICKTTDGGDFWYDIVLSDPQPNFLTSVSFFNATTGVTVGYDGRMYRTTNAGDNWGTLNAPLFRGNVKEISFIDANTGWLGCENGILLKTTNGGTSFTQFPLGIADNIIKISFVNSQTGYVACTGHILTTTNAGSTWSSADFSTCQLTSFSIGNQNVAYATLYKTIGMYPVAKFVRSTNFSSTWDTLPLPASGNFKMLKFINQNTGWLVAYPYYHMIYKTTDGANTWQQQLYVYSIYTAQLSCISAVDDLNCWVSGDHGTLYRTSNGGTNWSNITVGDTNSWYTPFVQFFDANTGIAFTNSPVVRIMKTSNGGLNWSPQVNCGVNSLNTMFFLNSMTGWGAGLNSLIKTTNGGEIIIGIRNNENSIPIEYSLSQNYPNPFNPNTTIKFAIPVGNGRDRSVKLTIFDVLGREITTLVDEQLQPGEYSVTWDASSCPSGVYFYKLEAGEYTQTRKMVLIK